MWFTETWARIEQPRFWATISGVFRAEDDYIICYHPMGKDGMCFRRFHSFKKEWFMLGPTRYERLAGPGLVVHELGVRT